MDMERLNCSDYRLSHVFADHSHVNNIWAVKRLMSNVSDENIQIVDSQKVRKRRSLSYHVMQFFFSATVLRVYIKSRRSNQKPSFHPSTKHIISSIRKA